MKRLNENIKEPLKVLSENLSDAASLVLHNEEQEKKEHILFISDFNVSLKEQDFLTTQLNINTIPVRFSEIMKNIEFTEIMKNKVLLFLNVSKKADLEYLRRHIDELINLCHIILCYENTTDKWVQQLKNHSIFHLKHKYLQKVNLNYRNSILYQPLVISSPSSKWCKLFQFFFKKKAAHISIE